MSSALATPRPVRADDLAQRQAERSCYRVVQRLGGRAGALVVTSHGHISPDRALLITQREALGLPEMACTAGDGPTVPLRIHRHLFVRPTLAQRVRRLLQRLVWSR
jgi:hypothetical protein